MHNPSNKTLKWLRENQHKINRNIRIAHYLYLRFYGYGDRLHDYYSNTEILDMEFRRDIYPFTYHMFKEAEHKYYLKHCCE